MCLSWVVPKMQNDSHLNSTSESSNLIPYLASGDEPFRACCPFERPCLCSVVQLNEVQGRRLELLNGIVDSAPEPPSQPQTRLALPLLRKITPRWSGIFCTPKGEGSLLDAY